MYCRLANTRPASDTDKKPSITVTVTAIIVDLASRASIIFRHRLTVSIKTNTEHISSLLDGELSFYECLFPWNKLETRLRRFTWHRQRGWRLLLGCRRSSTTLCEFYYALKTDIATVMLFIRAAILTFAKLFSFTVILLNWSLFPANKVLFHSEPSADLNEAITPLPFASYNVEESIIA